MKNPWSVRVLLCLKKSKLNSFVKVWQIIMGIEVPIFLPKGLILPHPIGIVISDNALINEDCIVYQNVTIGENSEGKAPVIGKGVIIYSGACVIGNIEIGDFSIIGANAVVLQNVPAYSVAVGVPAIFFPRKN
jgi:serine O-acetyltransferase